MKKHILFLLAVLVMACFRVGEIYADTLKTYSIEDPALKELDAATSAVIKKAQNAAAPWLSACSFVTETILLPSSKEAFLFVTTKDACGWGAAAGPIYILKGAGPSSQILLASSGYSLTPLNDTKHGRPNLLIRADTAGTETRSIFEFDSRRYTKKRD